MCTAMECKVADPVTHVPAHFIPQPNEHEIRGYAIPMLWQQDGQVASFLFYISVETGIYHMYYAGQCTECLHSFGLHYKSRYDQVFVDAIYKLSDKL